MRTFTEQEIYLPYGDPGRQKAVKSMVPRMDTRATNLDRLFSMARSHLLDLKLAERLAEREVAIDLQKFPLIQAWLADIKGDEQLLKDLLHTDGLYFWTKIKILDFLEQQQNVAPEVLGEEYRKLLVDYPGQWEIANGYAKYLERIGKNEDSRSVLNGWLALNVETLGLERIFITTAVARTYYNEGRYEEGFEVITPEIASWQAGAMQMGAKLLEKLNRKTESEKLARAIVDRYPDGPEYRAFLAGLYWSHGKPKEAADLLKAGGKRLNNNVWHFTIAPEFAEAFSEKTKEDALTAYSALIAQGFEPMDILSLVYPLEKKGKYDLAFELSSQIHANGIGNLFFLTHSYHCLKECKGKPDALDWLRKRVPPEMLNPLAMLAYTSGEYDPLWDIIGDPGKGRNADFVWVMRAAASERLGSDKDPHRNALMAHYEKKDGGIMDTANNMISGVTSRFSGGSKENDDGYYDQISRFLCGLTREEEILKLATDPHKRCEIAYYIAVRAQGEGRYSDASDWYRVALETGLTKMGEHRWANETLYMWLVKQKSLSRLQQERL